MIEDSKIFLLTEVNTRNIFEIVGNLCLTPARFLWKGHVIKIGHIMSNTSVEMHYNRQCKANNELFILASGIALIMSIVPGILFKGLAYLSSSVRAKHRVIKQSLNPEVQLPKGVSLTSDQGWCKIKFDLSESREQDVETFIGKKVLELKPNLSRGFIHHVEFGEKKYQEIDQGVIIDTGTEKVPLSVIFASRLMLNEAVGRCADPDLLWSICKIGNDFLLDF